MPAETIEISQSIIDQISSVEDEWKVIAYNNDITPFILVIYVLVTVVPMPEQDAIFATNRIHENGSEIVYCGTKEHAQKIGNALAKISVDYKIEK